MSERVRFFRPPGSRSYVNPAPQNQGRRAELAARDSLRASSLASRAQPERSAVFCLRNNVSKSSPVLPSGPLTCT
jgi:hypothetical protein